MSKKQVLGIIYGGKSSEHEVSLRTAFSILEAVNYEKWMVIPVYITLSGTWIEGERLTSSPQKVDQLRLQPADSSGNIFELAKEVHIFFPVVHGPYGEDGTLQGMLEMLDVPYVGSGVLGSALGMDKVKMKQIFAMHGFPQGDFLGLKRQQIREQLSVVCEQVESRLSYPCFVKPANLGSSVGISKAKDRRQLEEALILAAQYDQKVIVEQFIDGREIEIGVLGNDNPQTSVVGEIVTAGEFYDYAAKYKDTGTKLDIPARIPDDVARRIAELAKKAFLALECSGLSRVDFFWNEQADQLYVNEINTMPGFTPFSMYPLLFKEAGITYPTLIEELIRCGLQRFEEKKQNQVHAESLD